MKYYEALELLQQELPNNPDLELDRNVWVAFDDTPEQDKCRVCLMIGVWSIVGGLRPISETITGWWTTRKLMEQLSLVGLEFPERTKETDPFPSLFYTPTHPEHSYDDPPGRIEQIFMHHTKLVSWLVNRWDEGYSLRDLTSWLKEANL